MSNPQTFYTVLGGKDLSSLFQPYTSGQAKAATTNYKIPDGQDLSDIFDPYVSGYSKANATNCTVNGADINSIFAKKQNPLSITNQLYTSNQTFSDFIMPSGKNYFNFSLCGSGGQGYTTSTTTYGGGGSGGWIQATNIPYLLNSYSIASVSITIGGSTVVTVNYINNTTITLTAGQGQSANYSSGNAGQAGGTCSLTSSVGTGWNYSLNYIGVEGAYGGNQNSSGKTSGKTSSGSGANATSNNIDSINTAGPPGSFTLGIITVTSQGGGRSPTISSGYGAGGASTPSNYTGTGGAGGYRYGTSGCCIIYLT
jgi:hypothetical protein